MSINESLNQVISSVPECLAAGLVDIETGMLIGIRTVDSHPQEVIDLLAAATGDLFQGATVVTIEQMFKKARGLDPNKDLHYFQEIIVLSDNLIHVFIRGKSNKSQVLVTVCRPTANLGMALAKTRAALPNIEASF